jgi:hypothetical protein
VIFKPYICEFEENIRGFAIFEERAGNKLIYCTPVELTRFPNLALVRSKMGNI